MKFIILKADCNHNIWVLKGGKCYPYPTCPMGACMGGSLLFLGNPKKGNFIILLFWGLIKGVMSTFLKKGGYGIISILSCS
jgi:hypothetical protein